MGLDAWNHFVLRRGNPDTAGTVIVIPSHVSCMKVTFCLHSVQLHLESKKLLNRGAEII